jgi:hypothetical protein
VDGRLRVRVVGFARLVGELLAGIRQVMAWFGVAAAVAAALGVALDPFSVLVPFLVFSLGVSLGAQKTNGILQDAARHAPRDAARLVRSRRRRSSGAARPPPHECPLFPASLGASPVAS